ncbi:cysteine desulfurase NifS [Ruminococcus albus]|uniref:Cysteine desulfurase IscS n=1 Tax=Ruminococcus albus (strain ATCC 27210 / DSM 20455 / JCM 14654 / NCDO 2250 / 7) TaxID=697329 RepID=E6UIE7_RUMA7|nr:cysteine desulfurase NifS [Ruminococcus albus]ADU22208.1 cysteine desulfurase NifS [Ruminococcus albus 7 = DSM 20455]
MEKRFVYADNAATTNVSDNALNAMLPYLKEQYGNPSSIYSLGMDAAKGVLNARKQVAEALGAARPSEIYFTSGGSEADNLAIKSASEFGAKNGKRHIITTNIEHHAVLNTCEYLEKHGFEVTYLHADSDGIISPDLVEKAIRDDTAVVSVMAVNNEIGSIQPINEIGEICRSKGVLFHTDAVQATGQIHYDLQNMKIDMLSLSGHKFHAPKGVGALYVRSGIPIESLIHGGAQERGKRAGTENVAGIVAMGAAITDAVEFIDERNIRLAKMRDRLIDGILSEIPYSRLNGGRKHRSSGNVNVSFRGIEGESLILALDIRGIAASSGSACASGSIDPSHVLTAIGLDAELAKGSLRLTLGDGNTEDDIDYILEVLPETIKRLRSMSPMWQRICREEGITDYTVI